MVTTGNAVPQRVAVIGAGMAGMACAARLAEAGLPADIFEKSRGAGGRLSSRPVGGTDVDIGAQYATARGSAFRAMIGRRIETGGAAVWQPLTLGTQPKDGNTHHSREPWIVGRPGMEGLLPPLTPTGTLHTGWTVIGIDQRPDGWVLTSRDGNSAGPFCAVAVTAPAPQTLALIGESDPSFAAIADVIMAPCWTLACTFERPLGLDVDVLRPSGSPVTWSARNQSKSGRDRGVESWVIHGDPHWSREHLDKAPEAVSRTLLDAFATATQSIPLPAASAIKTHRWRYARVDRPVGASHLLDDTGTLGAAGDWCLGARVEAAFDSGRALGQALVERLRADRPKND